MTSTALAKVIDDLRCPVCHEDLHLDGNTVRCVNRHAFDIAKQGYLTLLDGSGHPGTGDTADMVTRRARFLARGHYDTITNAIADAAGDVDGLCVDIAGGTGHHLARILDRRPGLIGIDIDLSTFAVRRAARAHERLAAVRADAWRSLPLRDGTASVALNVFGPRNAAEIARVLAPNGRLVVITPRQNHLEELVSPLGMLRVDPRKQERLTEQLRGFTRVSHAAIEYVAAFTHADAADDVLMGPSAHHAVEHSVVAAINTLPEPIAVTISVDVTAYSR